MSTSSAAAPALHTAWAELLLSAMCHAGLRDVVVSPGSRSTPLALAAHESPFLRSTFVVDERSAAFFALGQARVAGRPTALVCTSGTAAAHYYPAVIEASMSGVPLIVITADRPWELQQAGASQTIDQTRLFGTFTRTYAALGAPEPTAAALRAVARVAAQLVARSLGPEPGPVHVNVPFRKPLEPASVPAAAEPWHATWQALVRSGPTRSLAAHTPLPAVDPAALDDVARLCDPARRGLLVCGPAPAHGDLDALRREASALARATGFPVLAETTSQLRFGLPALEAHSAYAAPAVVSAFDALLRSRSFRARLAPDLIVELGAPPTSAGYAQLLAEHPETPRIVVSPIGWTDPTSTASILVHADVLSFCAALRTRLTEMRLSDARLGERVASSPASSWSSRSPASPFARELTEADARARALIEASFPEAPTAPLTEAAVARAVIAACPADSTLILGNSSPVRDVDTFTFASPKPLRVLHQRGASGIDGLVSGAAGAQSVSKAAVTLLLGDLALLHDLGGLALARAATGPLAIVAVDNSGGRLFEQLPIGRVLGPGDTFERCFATPQPIDFAAAAATFDIPFAAASTEAELAAALARAHSHAGPTLIAAVVPPHDNAERCRTLWARIDELWASPQLAPTPSVQPRSRKDERS